MENLRTFVAIKLPEELKERLANLQIELSKTQADVRWVLPANIHLTLKFLGYIEASLVPTLEHEYGLIARDLTPFGLEFYGTGTFPQKGAPRVIWIGCSGELSRLKQLAAQLDEVSKGLQIPTQDQPFTPHITLGRVKSPRNISRLKEVLDHFKQTSWGQARVDSFCLFKSQLRPEGPIYTCLKTFVFG
jgi:2'-5' RNA ligase